MEMQNIYDFIRKCGVSKENANAIMAMISDYRIVSLNQIIDAVFSEKEE